MPKYIVDLWLDGYDTDVEVTAACDEFIREQLNITASSVEIEPFVEPKEVSMDALAMDLQEVFGWGRSWHEAAVRLRTKYTIKEKV